MKKSLIVALGAGMAVSLSGLAIANTNTQTNLFKTSAVTTHSHDLAHKNTDGKKTTQCKHKNGKCGTGKCKGKKGGKCGTGKCKGKK